MLRYAVYKLQPAHAVEQCILQLGGSNTLFPNRVMVWRHWGIVYNTSEENCCTFSLIMLVCIHKGMWAVILCFNKITQFLPGGANSLEWPA